MALLISEPASKVQVFVSCSKLKRKDKTDPCCLMYIQAGGQWKEVGRTEALKNNANPQFSKPIEVDYFFEEVQRVRFDLYDIDSKMTKVTDEDHLGFIETTLGEIISTTNFTKPLLLKGKPSDGSITLRAEDMSKNQESIQMSFAGDKLDKKDLLGKTDAFLVFSRKTRDGEWRSVLKTEVCKNSQSPSWRPLRTRIAQFCGGDPDSPIKVECYDRDSSTSHDLIGIFETSLSEIMRDGAGKQWALVNPKKAAKHKDYKNSGIVSLVSFEAIKSFSFLDFVSAGLRIGVTVAIDFTGSNGRIISPESLHHVGGNEPNAYMRAIEAVVGVMQEYDSDKVFPTFGFGAKIPPNKEASPVFPINLKTNNPMCEGVRGVLDSYKACLSEIELFGPTNFAPVIDLVAKFAAAPHLARIAQQYFVLLILTDGVITDLQDTIHSVVSASHLPMSIVMVGIGGSNFDVMRALDGDVLDTVAATKSRRDIVQFVAYRDCETPAKLAKQILAEIPRQVCEYYAINGIQPEAANRR